MLSRLPRPTDPNVLVGYDTNDDAGVYRLTDELALVQTVDFFTPIVDDPYTYGQIAAANALSDVYAMGGRPISALAVIGFPQDGDPEVMQQILCGGLAKMNEAGCAVVGGHSIRDDDLKFGYAVTGVINPRRVWRISGAQPGDVLLLTKPIGTGVIATALKAGRASEESLAASIAAMTRLNRDAAEAFLDVEAGLSRHAASSTEDAGKMPAVHAAVHAVTDITGFGFLGHAREMAVQSGVSLEIDHSKIEYLPGALDAAREGHLAGGLENNREFVAGCVGFADGVAEGYRLLLYDPQTSGGLLAALAPDAADAVLESLAKRNVPAHRIGAVLLKRTPLINVR